MIKRIVKMVFEEDKVAAFHALFEEKKDLIRGFQGCTHLELFQDINDPRIHFTYSYWKAESDLEAYRHSELFRTTWKDTKALFAEKAQAWSVRVASIPSQQQNSGV
jgi:heme-degrading monooxygenase HmoA